MVSPSKAEQQEQEQKQKRGRAQTQAQSRSQEPREIRSREAAAAAAAAEAEAERRSHVRIQKGSKPLEKKSFYLDIKNHALSNKLETKIKDLGGGIELFLVRSVTLVISDRVDKSGLVSGDKRKWGWVSGGSGGPPSLRSVEAPTPILTPATASPAAESPLANSTNLRGPALRPKSRADAMLERALTQPQQCSVDPLKNAENWGIPIWTTDKLQAWLDKIYASLRDTNNLKLTHNVGASTGRDPKVKHLKAPYIKFESFHRDTRPVFLELPSWPTLNFDGEPGSCPFDTKRREKKESKVSNKEVKENKEGNVLQQLEKDKDMTRRPRAGATRTRRTEQLVSGYCEICRIDYRDLSKHVQSDQHLNFVSNNDNFLALDTLINAGASVEAFLKLNGAKDIGKDCNLFPNGGRSLRSVVLPDDKVDQTTKSDLDNFSVDKIDMVQCNGARRNLNLKLSPPHNLRARTKHESGHLLRSKGSPWHEVDKSEKFYDKLEGFTIKKRSKGTIWIEEDDPEVKCVEGGDGDHFKQVKDQDCPEKVSLDEFNGSHCKDDPQDCQNPKDSNQEAPENNRLESTEHLIADEKSLNLNNEETQDCAGHDGKKDDKSLTDDGKGSKENELVDGDHENPITTEVGHSENDLTVEKGQKGLKTSGTLEKDIKNDTSKPNRTSEQLNRTSRRGGRTSRGRHRLSVEERLIEDNREYYKVEVLGNKLRSSAIPCCNSPGLTPARGQADEEGEETKKNDSESSEKPVVVRFKRVRKSELSLLSDEAESFMFGEQKRGESCSEDSDNEQSSVLPRETETESEYDPANSIIFSSSTNSSSLVKEEIVEEDSQDSMSLGRARKRRRTQAEALIKDNADYYKFETPGSRLRYQAPLTGIKDQLQSETNEKPEASLQVARITGLDNFYPSKPSPEVEKMQFSFEAVPKSEPWYQTYQRQDKGAEFWHCFSEGDMEKPFLLPYEIENFHETLMRGLSKGENGRKRGRGRGCGSIGRSPRKSPRCHASTLAIMSTIIRKREQQQQHLPNLSVIEEDSQSTRSSANTPKPDGKPDKSDVDEDLKDIAKKIDDMLCGKNFIDLEDSFDTELNMVTELNLVVDASVPKGPPPNLLELLDNCQDVNCLDNSSCASSECGEVASVESPLKRRKRRKNRTGWPGIKMRKKLQIKQPIDADCERENVPDQKLEGDSERLLDSLNNDTISNRLQNNMNKGITQSNTNGLGQAEVEYQDQISQENGKATDGTSCTSKLSNRSSSNENLSTRHKNLKNPAGSLARNSENSRIASKNLNQTSTRPDRGNSLRNDNTSFSRTMRNLSRIDEDLDRSHKNDENYENSTSVVSRRQYNTPDAASKKRPRKNTVSSDTHLEDEICDNSYRREDDTVTSRKQQSPNAVSKKRPRKDAMSSEPTDSDLREGNHKNSRKQQVAKKHQRKDATSFEIHQQSEFEDDKCKRDGYHNVTPRKQQNSKKRQRRDTVSSDIQESEVDCSFALSDRVSPTTISSTEFEQRRSSIEFQPVVRMTKIDEQVDMDNGVLSVTVASNRRLRSSSSPRSNLQPPAKRFRTAKGQFSRWIKNS